MTSMPGLRIGENYGNRPDLLRTMHGRDYSASTIGPILKEVYCQTKQGEEQPLEDKVRDAIWECKTQQEALEAATKVLKADDDCQAEVK